MKVALITPPTLLGLIPDTKYNLVLAQWLNNSRYAEYYSHQGAGYVIMDNGAAEDEMPDEGTLLKLAVLQLQPDVMIVPDVLGEWLETLNLVKGFKARARIHRTVDYYAVAQGTRYPDFRGAVRRYAEDEEYDYLAGVCLPRLMTNRNKFARIRLLDEMAPLFESRPFGLHCLGSGPWVKEVRLLADYPFVEGIDTSAPIVMGLLGLDVTKDRYPGRSGLTTPYRATTVAKFEKARSLIEHNVYTYLAWSRGE